MALSGRGPMPRAARPTCPVCQKPDGTSGAPVRFKALLGCRRAKTGAGMPASALGRWACGLRENFNRDPCCAPDREDGETPYRSRTGGRASRTGRNSWKPDARRTGRRQGGPMNRQAENAAPFATPAGALACRPEATGHRRQPTPACETTDRLPARARGSRTLNEQGPRMRERNNRSSTCCPTSWP